MGGKQGKNTQKNRKSTQHDQNPVAIQQQDLNTAKQMKQKKMTKK